MMLLRTQCQGQDVSIASPGSKCEKGLGLGNPMCYELHFSSAGTATIRNMHSGRHSYEYDLGSV
ncbi:hypothetical protein SODALDRAFT_329866 [Sodiomyces alkalinus F11]|uniref:Uncharacterized protein n=1 Tax=Sodiomyces alkalinus (strain CBS 110278 / VKM F-3762 / F11) TaxID=1314773 RepID=A0A3N2Q0C8_SODAK|nr:hypothetical protein SODALDRAFT_329866 [Sodiomyces alkalinus F11]ROT40192.1 hypothetical protein SODALDRAFT_329866 [Sodiomyces alkalinus F11]